MLKNYKDLLGAALAVIETIPTEDAIKLVKDDSIVFVDLRDRRELEREGRIPGAFHCPRGMLEFWIDPESPYHKPRFAEPKTFVFYCASGWRSLLAARVAQEMGLDARSMLGGFGEWKKSGKPVAAREKHSG